jgi:hypothetical protein
MNQSETIVIDAVQKSGHLDEIEIAMTEEVRNRTEAVKNTTVKDAKESRYSLNENINIENSDDIEVKLLKWLKS